MVVEPRVTAKEIKEKNPLMWVSVHMTQRRLKDDHSYENSYEKKLLTKKRQKRVIFCKKYLNWNLERWELMLWTDAETGNRGTVW